MRKMRSIMIILVITLTVILTGCGNSIVKKSIEHAKTEMESKNYDKALVSLELALSEDKDNKEAIKTYSIIETYLRAKKELDAGNINEGKKTLDGINSEYMNYTIKEDIELLKISIEEKIREVEIVNANISQAEGLANEKKFDVAKTLIEEINKKSLNEEQKNKISELSANIDTKLAAIEEQRKAEDAKKAEEAKKAAENNKPKSSQLTGGQAQDLIKDKYTDPSLNSAVHVDGLDTTVDGILYYYISVVSHGGSGASTGYYVNSKNGTVIHEIDWQY